jgi:hypothetical protein
MSRVVRKMIFLLFNTLLFLISRRICARQATSSFLSTPRKQGSKDCLFFHINIKKETSNTSLFDMTFDKIPSKIVTGPDALCVTSSPTEQLEERGVRDVTPPVSEEDSDEQQPFVTTRSATCRRCNYCGATSTPMWRHGPGNYTNLCNSCGVKWRRGKILSNGEHRHHLCKPPTPAKQKKGILKQKSVPRILKRKQDEEWQALTRPGWTPEASQEPEEQPTPKKQKLLNREPASPIENPMTPVSPIKSQYSTPIPQEIHLEVQSVGSIDEKPAPEVLAPIVIESPQLPKETECKINILEKIPAPCSTSKKALDPKDANYLIEVLSNRFADLLENLPYYKTAAFTSILANCFQPKVAEAYKKGLEVEMSVLDISEDTWEALYRMVC